MASTPVRRHWKRLTAWIVTIFVGIAAAGLFFVSLAIGGGIHSYSRRAQSMFPGERVEALIAMVDCQNCILEDRNHAVWALGQLAEKRALPVLQKYYTGMKCDHERFICQYELRKALNLAAKGHNPSAFLWRWMLSE
jgi:hypothetical protein